MDFFTDLAPVLQDALFTLAGAAGSGALIWLIRRLSNMRAERQYSLSGEYRAFYHDIVDQEDVTQGGTVILKQNGLRFTADHYDYDSSKSWGLKGEIDKATGHVFGYYKAKSHLDAGIGVFIFEQKNKDELTGIWAGYDNHNRKINQGGYTLKRRLPIKIRRATAKDTIKVLHLACEALGDGYLSDAIITDHITRKNLHVATYEREIVAFMISRILPSGDLSAELKHHKYRIPADLKRANENGTIGLLQSIATAHKFQGKGVGKRLVEHATASLKKRGAQQVISLGWKTDTVHIGKVLEGCGFKVRHTFSAFWKEESLDKGYDCPQCGAPPCECDAVLFSRT